MDERRTSPQSALWADCSPDKGCPGKAGEAERRVGQLRRLSGILIDRLEQAVEGKEFSIKEIRTYTNTLMDLRQIQMTDPELIAKEQELKLIKLRREAGELAPRQLTICFEGGTEQASE